MARGYFKRDIRLFVGCLSLILFVELIANFYFRSALTTIERRFELSSAAVALLSSVYQIGNLFVMVFVCYYGSKSHRPRVIAIGTTLIVVGYLISCIPQFIGDRYKYVDNDNHTTAGDQLCKSSLHKTDFNISSCNVDVNNKLENKLYIFVLIGIILSGIGAAPLQPLGMSYIDDFSSPHRVPIYIGVVLTVALIGPAVGYMLGAVFLQIWVDSGWVNTDDFTISSQHVNWVGAWWLGFLFCGILMAFATIPMCLFSRRMKIKYKNKIFLRHSENHPSDVSVEKVGAPTATAEGLIAAIKRLMTNFEYLGMLSMLVFSAFYITGIINYFPKFLEVQLGASPSKADMSYGAIGIPCIAVGTMLGSYIMKRHNPNKIGMVKLAAASHFCTTLLTLPMLFMGCKTIDIAGVTVPYSDSTCSSSCHCDANIFSPICGSDGITYLSPCHAGCKNTFQLDGQIQNYTECSCINFDDSNMNSLLHGSSLGSCKTSNCSDLLIIVLAIQALASVTSGLSAPATYVFLMRIVNTGDKALGIGIAFIVVRLLAWIPGPIFYGKLFDSSCLYWTFSKCSQTGYCGIYDCDAYRTRYFGVVVFASFASWICSLCIYVLLKHKSSKHNKTKIEFEKDSFRIVEEVTLNTPDCTVQSQSSQLLRIESGKIIDRSDTEHKDHLPNAKEINVTEDTEV
ncbi:solute carrier organic anion transporter family member 2A1-like [Styela clava]